MRTKIDIGSENFDLYFYHQANSITPEEKERLPKEIVTTLWRHDGKVNLQRIKLFSIWHKLFILFKAARKNIYIVIQDDDKGMNPSEFLAWQKANKKKDYGLKLAGQLKVEMQFTLANKEVCDVFNYLNHLSHSPAYNYLTKLKYQIPNSSADYKKQMKYLARVFMNWERSKKGWIHEFGIDLPELYVLLTLYAEGEIVGSSIYKEIFRRAYQSGAGKIKKAFGTLQVKGLIERQGSYKGATMRITAIGMDVINRAITKYAINS